MRAILYSTCYTQTPPKLYGGIEYIVYLLGKKLVEKGIETFVIGSQDSPDPVAVGAGYNIVKTLPTGHSEHSMWDVVRDQVLAKNLIPIDDQTVFIDFSHEKWLYLYKKDNPKIHVIGSIHDALPWNTPPPVKYPCLSGISKQQSLSLSQHYGVHVETSYNGVEESQYPLFTGKRNNNMLFVSRITKEKAPHEAIHIANSIQTPLILAGSDSPMFCEQTYVHSIISKSDGKFITYLGEVPQQKKVELYQTSKFTVLPIIFPEPFGLVAIESMLCGTPVLALNNGAYRETIIDGKGGYVCSSIDEMIKKAKYDMDELNPEKVRENGLIFTADRMAERYIELMNMCLVTPW